MKPDRRKPAAISVRCAHDKLVPLTKLKPHPRNPNTHPEAQVDLLAKILAAQGWRNAIVVSKRSGLIVNGHGRLLAAQKLGLATAPVNFQAFDSEAQEMAHLVADNKIAELAETDDETLKALISELGKTKLDLALLGLGDAEMQRLLAEINPPESDDDHAADLVDKAAELQKVWKTKLGQVWELGEHRLACGSSVVNGDVASMVLGDLCQLCVTDPPYGVSYASKNAFLNSCDKGNRVQAEIENDHEDKEKTQAMWKSAFSEMAGVLSPGAVVYCFMPQGGDQMMMMMMMTGAGIEPRHELIWLKNNHVLGRVDYAYKHEPILYAWKKGGHKFYGGFQTSILEFNKPTKSDLHPTMKPVELVAKLITNSSKSGDLVYEPFSGSGTTLIACEQLNRRCRAMEIDPGYVAVALQRWSDLTGKTPKLCSTSAR